MTTHRHRPSPVYVPSLEDPEFLPPGAHVPAFGAPATPQFPTHSDRGNYREARPWHHKMLRFLLAALCGRSVLTWAETKMALREERAYAEGKFLGHCCAAWKRTCACAAVVACVVLLLVGGAHTSSTDTVHLSDVIGDRPGFVRHGENGVDLLVASKPLHASDVQADSLGVSGPVSTISGLTALFADYFDEHICLCAPQFNVKARVIAVQKDNQPFLLINPQADEAWDGHGEADLKWNVERTYVTDSQRTWFPKAEPEFVEVPRIHPLRITYRNADFASRSMIIQRPVAYCVQTCLLLLDGVSVHENV